VKLSATSTLPEVAVARHQTVDLEAIRTWSRSEGKLDDYHEFLRDLRRVG